MAKRYLWDELPWLSMMPHEGRPRVVACSGFGWLMSAELTPPDMSSASPEERLRNAARFMAALQTLGGGRWVWVEERREPLPGIATLNPGNRGARLFAKDRAGVFHDGAQYGSRHFLSMRWNPPSGLAVRIRNAFLMPEQGETRGDFGTLFDDYVRSFEQVCNLLKFMGARILEGDDLATYLRSTISVNSGPIHVEPYEWLAPQLVDSPLYGGRPLWLGHEHNRLNVRAVQINTYPRRMETCALDFGNDTFDGLTELGCRIRRVKRFRIQSQQESVRELEWLTKKAAMTQESMLLNVLRQFQKDASSPLTNKASTLALEEADSQLMEMQRSGIHRCQTTDNVLVYHEDRETAKKQAQMIEEFLLSKHFGCEINELTTHDCVLGAIPGKTDVDFVRPAVNLLAASASSPLTRSWSGDLHVPESPILLHGRTSRTNRFALSLHIKGAVRHCFACGGTGGGKTSLLNSTAFGHLAAVPNGRVVRVESGRSGYVAAKLAGGVTFNIGEAGCGVQPLRGIDKAGDRDWAHSWIMARIKSQIGEQADTTDISQAVGDALRAMALLPPDDRTMTTFALTVPNETAARAMRQYTKDGTLGYIFDAVDGRSYDADWINFELGAITNDHEALAAPALISYLWRFIMRMSSSRRPMLLQLDEASAYVAGSFVKGLEWGLRTYRKLKTQVVFATQSILDLSKSEISHIILNSCPTQVFVQDTAVLTKKGLEVLGELRLTEHDAEIIASMPQAGAYFIHRPGVGKAVVSFDLGSPISAAMVLQTDDEHYQHARRVERRGGDFLTEWMNEHGVPAAKSLGEAVDDTQYLRAAE